jgi:hypothetical protein
LLVTHKQKTITRQVPASISSNTNTFVVYKRAVCVTSGSGLKTCDEEIPRIIVLQAMGTEVFKERISIDVSR